MVKKFMAKAMVVALLLVGVGFTTPSLSHAEDSKDITLTEEQIKELRDLHSKMLEQKKTIIEKYVEYGVIPEDKATKIIEHMEEKYKQLEESKFVPNWEKKHHNKHKH
ncbi:DUF2680 domain-containing protein [Aquibacillus salsiterrae]|uniref:YckD family protein n=1 Tax=Aquibacillus salsiterrae TaxID=2950439 RepID=A0A9X4AEA7_9BACI|nr:DUF2680 domain-containing protein [Aquibacillus salsiterrae]MDC3416319.1 YckD family protein [Aquibacillus salsiterrae]